MPSIQDYILPAPNFAGQYIGAQQQGAKDRAVADQSQQDQTFRAAIPGVLQGDQQAQQSAAGADPERFTKLQASLAQMNEAQFQQHNRLVDIEAQATADLDPATVTPEQIAQAKQRAIQMGYPPDQLANFNTGADVARVRMFSQEWQKAAQAKLAADQVAHSMRLQDMQFGETRRHNMASEALDQQKITAAKTFDPGYIEGIANYRIAPPSNRAANRDVIMAAAQRLNPTYDEKRYGAANRALGAFTSGPQGNTVRSLNVSVAHLETLRDLGEALNNGDIQAFNALSQAFAQQTGVPAPTNFDTAKAIVADEVAKGVIGGTTAQSDREQLAESIRRASSPQQLEGAIGTFQHLLAGQLGGLRHQYENATGAKDFQEMLNPETRRVLDRFPESGATGSAPQRSPASAAAPGAPQEGARATSKSGKPIVFQNGHWQFVQ